MYIDEGSGPLGAVGQGMRKLVASANSGAFAVSPEGGEALLKAIRNLIEWLDGEHVQLDALRDVS